MRFLRELVEPWGVLLAATSAGAAWAVQLPIGAAAGVGGAVLVAKAAVATWQDRDRAEAPRVEAGSEEASWVRRAEDAADEFDAVRRTLPAGPLSDQVTGMESGVDETLQTLRRLAARTSTTTQAMRRIDAGALAEERQRLQRQTAADLRADVEKSLASLERQQAVHNRLSAARAKLLAQLTAGAHGLEELVARVAELSATSDAGPELGGDTLGDLTDRLEGIRRGVAEADEATRRSLGDL